MTTENSRKRSYDRDYQQPSTSHRSDYGAKRGSQSFLCRQRGHNPRYKKGKVYSSQNSQNSAKKEQINAVKVLKNLKNTNENFKAGSISSHFSTWVKITSDKWLLDIVKTRYFIEFESEPSVSDYFNQPSFSKKEAEIISQEIEKLIKMDVLKSVVPYADQF